MSIPGIVTTENYSHDSVLDKDQNYVLFWKYNTTHVTFEVHVKTKGYVGFGISTNGKMHPADVIVGWVKNGTTHFAVSTSYLNPYLPNRLFHPYQLDESISDLRGVWCFFFFFFFFSFLLCFNSNSSIKTMQTQIRRRVLRRLIWVYTVFQRHVYGTLCIYGLNLDRRVRMMLTP